MASSQVEVASSSQFGCVLRDRNQRSGCKTRDSNAFRKNVNDSVQNQLNSCRNSASGSVTNENSHPAIDTADLWVHHPQATNEKNKYHAREPGHARIFDQSRSSNNAREQIDYADLWVHNPEINDDENNQISNCDAKCDRARDAVLAVDTKSENGVSPVPLPNPPRGRNHDTAPLQPVSKVRSPESSGPASLSQRRMSLDCPPSAVSASQKGKSQNGTSSSLVSTSQSESFMGVPPLSSQKRRMSLDCPPSGPASTSLKGKSQNGVSSTSQSESSMEVPPLSSQRRMSLDYTPCGPASASQKGKSQNGTSSSLVSTSRSESSMEVPPLSSQKTRMSLDCPPSGSASTSQKEKNQYGVSSFLVSNSQSESSVEVPPLSSLRRRMSLDCPPSGPASTSQKEKNQNGVSSSLVSTSQSEGSVEVPPLSSQRRRMSLDCPPSGPASTSQKEKSQNGTTSSLVSTSQSDSSVKVPPCSSQRRRSPDCPSSGLASTSQKEKSQKSTPSSFVSNSRSESSAEEPVSRGKSPESSRPPFSSQRRMSLDCPPCGLTSTSQRGKSQNGMSSSPVSTCQSESFAEAPLTIPPRGKNHHDGAQSQPVSRRMSLDCSPSGLASTSQKGKSQRGMSSSPVSTSQSESSAEVSLTVPPWGRSHHDGALSQPVSRRMSLDCPPFAPSSQRRMSLESPSQKGKSQNGMSSSPVSTSKSESSAEVPNLGAVSSLVQKWRNFEGKSTCCSSKCNSGMVDVDNASFVEAHARGSDACDESIDIRPNTPTISENDWDSARTYSSVSPGIDSDAAEKERNRVAVIIKKLSSNSEEHGDREPALCHQSLPRVRTSVDKSEQRPYSPVCCSPRIRGRQAFCDFQMQMERERHKELEVLAGHNAVSKFSHRGRIQAMLKVRFLHRGAEVKDGQHPKCISSNSNGLKQSAIMHLREIFNLGAKRCASDLRTQQVEAVDCNTGIEKLYVCHRQRKENCQDRLIEPTNSVESDTSTDAEGSFRSNSVKRDVDNHQSNNKIEKSAVQVRSSRRKENHQPELAQLANPPMTVSKGSLDTKSSCSSMPVQGDTNCLESNSIVQKSNLPVQNSENLYQEASSTADDVEKWSHSASCNHGKPEFLMTGTSSQCSEGNIYREIQEANNQQLTGNRNDLINAIAKAQDDWEDQKVINHTLFCSSLSDVFEHLSGLEELQADYQTNNDWINDVSRPRSTWEDLRQARYQEMLDPFMENYEIRHLLERKSVSSFLSSDMRERIDQLMLSRKQQLSRPSVLGRKSEQERIKEEHERGEEEEYGQNNEEEEEEEDSDDYDDYEDQEHKTKSGKHNTAKNYINQTTSWVEGRGHEVSDNYSDHAASPYIEQQSPLSNLSTLESQRSMNRHSIEMELIYELKGNMEQVHKELFELRRSIKSCVDMQMEFQQTIKEEIRAALCQSGKQKRRERRDSSRGRCCICYEVPIDSLLYRCGHMCTCFKCAHELQWGSGKCPVCEAPIIDVVRVHPPS